MNQYNTYVNDGHVPFSFNRAQLNDMRRLIAETSDECLGSTQDDILVSFIEWLFDPEIFGVEEEETP